MIVAEGIATPRERTSGAQDRQAPAAWARPASRGKRRRLNGVHIPD